MANELILIVEDDHSSRRLLQEALLAVGYQTVVAETGEEGVALASSHLPALILMDIQLPGISGIEALRFLRSQRSTQSIPVVAVTASVMNMQRADLLQAGFDGLEWKPISIMALLETVRAKIDARAGQVDPP